MMLRYALDTFWTPKVWLPPNVTWEDVNPHGTYKYTDYRHMYIYPIPLAFVILLIRFLVERYCFKPFGLWLGISDQNPRKARSNVVLENAYQHDAQWKPAEVLGLAKQVDWTERQVHRWLRTRKLQEKPSTLTKFCENSWRSLYYTSSFLYGLAVLWNKPWFRDINHCWLNYPHHGVTADIWWYYMISAAFYWSLMFSQFFDVKRKDFWQMFVHHSATIVLLSLSWVCNLHRVGTLVLVIHDAADCLLDATKAVKYAKYEKLCNCLLVIFIITWITTRIVIFPLWIIKSTTLEAPYVAKQMFPAYFVFNGLLIMLLVLHIYWTYLILQLVYRAVKMGQIEDVRSSDSESASSDERRNGLPNSNGLQKEQNNVFNHNHVE